MSANAGALFAKTHELLERGYAVFDPEESFASDLSGLQKAAAAAFDRLVEIEALRDVGTWRERGAGFRHDEAGPSFTFRQGGCADSAFASLPDTQRRIAKQFVSRQEAVYTRLAPLAVRILHAIGVVADGNALLPGSVAAAERFSALVIQTDKGLQVGSGGGSDGSASLSSLAVQAVRASSSAKLVDCSLLALAAVSPDGASVEVWDRKEGRMVVPLGEKGGPFVVVFLGHLFDVIFGDGSGKLATRYRWTASGADEEPVASTACQSSPRTAQNSFAVCLRVIPHAETELNLARAILSCRLTADGASPATTEQRALTDPEAGASLRCGDLVERFVPPFGDSAAEEEPPVGVERDVSDVDDGADDDDPSTGIAAAPNVEGHEPAATTGIEAGHVAPPVSSLRPSTFSLAAALSAPDFVPSFLSAEAPEFQPPAFLAPQIPAYLDAPFADPSTALPPPAQQLTLFVKKLDGTKMILTVPADLPLAKFRGRVKSLAQPLQEPFFLFRDDVELTCGEKSLAENGITQGNTIALRAGRKRLVLVSSKGHNRRIDVEDTDTVAKVIADLHRSKAMPIAQDHLYWDGGEQLLHPERSLGSYGIPPMAMLVCKQGTLAVHVCMEADGRKFDLHVFPEADRLLDLKYRIFERSSVPVETQSWKLAHRRLERSDENLRLAELGITEGGDVKLSVSVEMVVRLRMGDDAGSETLSVTTTLTEPSWAFQARIGLPDGCFLFNVDEDRWLASTVLTLTRHGVKPGTLLVARPGPLAVTVEADDGRSYTTHVHPKQLLLDLLTKIKDHLGYPELPQLAVDGVPVPYSPQGEPPACNVSKLRIASGSVLRVSETKLAVTVVSSKRDQPPFTVRVKNDGGLRKLLQQICLHIHAPPTNVSLAFEGKGLERALCDGLDLKALGIVSGSTVHYTYGEMSVFFKASPSAEPIEVQITTTTVLRIVKERIKEALGQSLEGCYLMHGNELLKPDSSAVTYGLQHGAELTPSPPGAKLPSAAFPIFVHTTAGRIVDLQVEPNTTIAEVKAMVQAAESTSLAEHIMTTSGGSVLDDSATLIGSKISPMSALRLLPRSIASAPAR